MIIKRSSILPNQPTLLNEDESFTPDYFKDSYPIKDILSCHLEGEIAKSKTYLQADLTITAKVVLLDSYTNEPFRQKITLQEKVDLLEKEDEEGEGYIIEGNEIDLSELCLKMIRSSLPIKVLKPGSKLPKSGEGFRVLSEEEIAKEKSENYNPAFDALKDYDPEK
ncbi:MAG: hypothetical protein BWY98_01110 [Tenericutes bacterium ADurb.BinA155]|nr:MAG: hypothetical protein BWY98_01110 [Tenericutes bacterium ADurb.BinA155]